MGDNRILRSLSSTRVRAGLSLGVVAALGVTGTFAYWTDSVAVTGTTFQSGTFKLAVDNGGGYGVNTNASGSLNMSNMAPGYSSAQAMTLKNAGNVPLKWTLSGQLGGTDAGVLSGALTFKVTTGSPSGPANGATCTGTVLGSTTLGTAATAIVGTPQPTTAGSGVGGGATVPLCFEVDFDQNAATSLQGKTATATFTFDASSNIS